MFRHHGQLYGARYLRPALQSSCARRLTSWELILVDDASTTDVAVVSRRQMGPAFTSSGKRPTAVRPARNRSGAARATGCGVRQRRSHGAAETTAVAQRARNDEATIVADNLMLFSDSIPTPTRATLRPAWTVTALVSLAEFINSTGCMRVRPILVI